MYEILITKIFPSLITLFIRLHTGVLDKPINFSTIFAKPSPAILVLRCLLKISRNGQLSLTNFHKDSSLTKLQ